MRSHSPFPLPEAADLLGRLLGLSRATEGNEHKVTAALDRLVLEGLSALPPVSGLPVSDAPGASSMACLADLSAAVYEAKRQLIPLCFDCAAPCGRNNDYDFNGFAALSPEDRALRLSLLEAAQALAKVLLSGPASSPGSTDPQVLSSQTDLLYSALYALGRDDWGPELLLPLLECLQQLL